LSPFSGAERRYDKNVTQLNRDWQSKLVLLLVVPYITISLVFQARLYSSNAPAVAIWALGLSALLGLVAWKLRTATPAAALTGAAITASLMFSTLVFPYQPWKTGLVPVLVVLVLTSLATRFGRRRKERLGTTEKNQGRGAAQVAANLGAAALVMDPAIQSWLIDTHRFSSATLGPIPIFAVGLAALAEAAADTVSSEVGQVLGGQPRMLTTLRRVDPGTDGGVTLAGTAAGVIAAAVVALVGCVVLRGDAMIFAVGLAGGVFGLFFDSLLGATLERQGWLNNDAVNFLSTASAAGFALALLAALPHPGVG
jgi:uncharacterized protein (TIGR00297 family)